jgi:hypothetical protein
LDSVPYFRREFKIREAKREKAHRRLGSPRTPSVRLFANCETEFVFSFRILLVVQGFPDWTERHPSLYTWLGFVFVCNGLTLDRVEIPSDGIGTIVR